MARALPASVLSAITGSVVKLAFFAEFQFASGTLRMWSGYGDKSWGGQTWTGAGDLGTISAVDETTEIGASGLTFSLAGISSSLRSLALGDNYRGRLCKLWLAILDAGDNVVDAYQIYGGRMDVLSLTAASPVETRISVKSESRLVDLLRARASRYTDAEQQRRFAGDLGCEYAAKLAEKPLWWGVPPPARAASPGLGGGGSGGMTRDEL